MPEPKSDADRFREITEPLPFADYHPVVKVGYVLFVGSVAAVGLGVVALILGLLWVAIVAVWGWTP